MRAVRFSLEVEDVSLRRAVYGEFAESRGVFLIQFERERSKVVLQVFSVSGTHYGRSNLRSVQDVTRSNIADADIMLGGNGV